MSARPRFTQPDMFPAGEDLPLFTGLPVAITQRPTKPPPQESWTQIEMTLYRTTRPELFYPQRDALNNLSGPVVELPAGTLVRFVQSSCQFRNKVLVATADDLFAWSWADFLTQL